MPLVGLTFSTVVSEATVPLPALTLPRVLSYTMVTLEEAAATVKLKLLSVRVAVVLEKPLLETSTNVTDAPASNMLL